MVHKFLTKKFWQRVLLGVMLATLISLGMAKLAHARTPYGFGIFVSPSLAPQGTPNCSAKQLKEGVHRNGYDRFYCWHSQNQLVEAVEDEIPRDWEVI